LNTKGIKDVNNTNRYDIYKNINVRSENDICNSFNHHLLLAFS
jgi:hypothetical protein